MCPRLGSGFPPIEMFRAFATSARGADRGGVTLIAQYTHSPPDTERLLDSAQACPPVKQQAWWENVFPIHESACFHSRVVCVYVHLALANVGEGWQAGSRKQPLHSLLARSGCAAAKTKARTPGVHRT